jgi:trimeric autotransporter adhesin
LACNPEIKNINMKAKLTLTFLFILMILNAAAQTPNGFNYQAIARDNSGNPIPSVSLQVKLAVTADSLGNTVYWEELFNPVTTNAYGLFTVVLGQGVRQNTSTVATFPSISWKSWPLFVKTQIFYQGAWKVMGSSRLWSVPYAMSVSGNQEYLNVTGNTAVMDSALFIVRNNTGQTIFAVYNEGVRIFVDNGVVGKGTNKGGFAIGGFGSSKAPSQEYFRVTGDSTRIYVNPASSKGSKGGFAIGGFGSKTSTRYMNLTPNNYFIGQGSGDNITSGLYNTFAGYLSGNYTSSGSMNVFLGYQAGWWNSGGNSNVFVGNSAGYLNVASNNVFLGFESGYSNTTGTIDAFMGYKAGRSNTTGSSNVFVGNLSGFSNTTGSSNVLIGDQAGYSGNADYNTYLGYQSGYSTTTGGYNAFIGYKAGYANTTGYYNVMMGFMSGQANTTGWGNTFLGPYSGNSNTTGSTNTFVGNSAGFSSNGASNTFIGYDAGHTNTTGSQNTFLGFYSGSSVTTGSSNVIMGTQSGATITVNNYNTMIGDVSGRFTVGDNNTFMGYGSGYNCQGSGDVLIGYNAGQQLAASNKLVIENSTNITTPLVGGDFTAKRVGIGRMPTTYTLEVAGTIWANGSTISAGSSTWSDARYKEDISPITNALDDVMKLQGVKYNWRRSSFPQLNFPGGEQIGVIAQDVEKVVPDVVTTAADGYKSVSYEKLVPVLIEAIKDQQKQIEELKAQVNQLSREQNK